MTDSTLGATERGRIATAELFRRRSPIGGMARALLLCGALLSGGCAAYGPPHAGERTYRDLVFAEPGGHPLRMDVYVPQSSQPVPVVMWIFGGSWKIGSKGYHVNLRDLTRSGIAVASIEYRLSGTAKYPAQLDDCETALRWLQTHGRSLGLDPRRIGVSGESAGGHLAALLGTVEGTPRIRAVCALYPPTDLVSLGRKYANPKGPSDIERLLGGPIEHKLTLAAAASPVNHVSSSSPPFLIIHGARDELVPLEQSRELQRRLTQAHVPSRLIVVPGKGHWFLLDARQLNEVAEFFRSHL
ncbi:MAG: alpha/beta hydrolase [Chthoniobacter sp.]|uniref:alpha/beta hydrolase n=1 Tax=Chthoniobacter sp. TaxID=2510640 RepID=UPI0032A1C02E